MLFFKTVDGVIQDIVDSVDSLKRLAIKHQQRAEYYSAQAVLNRTEATRAERISKKLENLLGD